MKAQKPIPPRFPQKLLLRFLRNDLTEEVLGDLEEKFYFTLKTRSLFRARLNYWYQVFQYLRPFAIRKSRSSHLNHYAMFQSYFKIGWRNLLKNKSYSFINIGGLAVGMTVAILNGLWIWDELSFNRYHENYSRIAQVASRGMNDDGGQYASNSLQYPLTNVLETNYHHSFKHLVRASWEQDHILSFGEKKIGGIGQFIGHGAPEMLSLKMIYGTWAGLKDPHSIMISMSISKALFGSSDPTNKMMRVNNRLDVKVTGVFEDLPLNSRFHQIKFFCPWELWVLDNNWIQTKAINDWDNHFIKMYAEILPGTSFTAVSEKIKDAEVKNLGNFKEQAARKPEVFLHPMSEWHLFPLESDGGPVRMIWLVGTMEGPYYFWLV